MKTLEIIKRLFLRLFREDFPQDFTLKSVLEEIELTKALRKPCLEIPRTSLADLDGLELMRSGFCVRLTHNEWGNPLGQTWRISWP